MEDVLFFATVIAPIVLAFVQLIKSVAIIEERYMSLVALVVGMLLGFAAAPFSDLDSALRLWSGALAGLSATGLFELTTTPRKDG